MDKPVKKSPGTESLTGSPYVKRLALSFGLFVGLYLLYFPLSSSLENSFTAITQAWLASNVNHDTATRKVFAEKNKETNYEIKFITYYYDLQDDKGNIPAKTISVDFRREYYLPLIIFFSLMVATPVPVRKKLFFTLGGLITVSLYLYFKFYVMIFDNYNSPDYAVTQLSGLKSFLVYHGVEFLGLTGASTIAVIPVVIWLIFAGGSILKMAKAVE